MIYSKLLGQYGRHQRKKILEKAIHLGEKSKKNRFLIINYYWLSNSKKWVSKSYL